MYGMQGAPPLFHPNSAGRESHKSCRCYIRALNTGCAPSKHSCGVISLVIVLSALSKIGPAAKTVYHSVYSFLPYRTRVLRAGAVYALACVFARYLHVFSDMPHLLGSCSTSFISVLYTTSRDTGRDRFISCKTVHLFPPVSRRLACLGRIF